MGDTQRKPVLRISTGGRALHYLGAILVPVTHHSNDEKPVSSMVRLNESIRMTKQGGPFFWSTDLFIEGYRCIGR